MMPPGDGGGPSVQNAGATTPTGRRQAAPSGVGCAPRRRGSESFAERTSATRRRWTRRRDAADRIGTTTPSEHSLDAWAATITDLQRHGAPAVVDVATLRALWRRGGSHRRLAEQVHATAVTR